MTDDLDEPIEHVITADTLAKRLGINRATIVRLEQRRILPVARRIAHPFAGRVYNDKEAAEVERLVRAYFARAKDVFGEATVVDSRNVHIVKDA